MALASRSNNSLSDDLVVNLVEGINIFETSKLSIIRNVKILDTIGEEIEFGIKITSNQIEVFSLIEINNVLINLQGE